MTRYDYIFAGAGCSGLSLLMRMLAEPTLRNKTVLLIDKVDKNQNDRTWCFWEQEQGPFEEIVYRSWSRLGVYGKKDSIEQDISPYSYKMIRGIDFYQYCFREISKYPNVTLLKATVLDSGTLPRTKPGQGQASDQQEAFVETDQGRFTAEYLFNSIVRMPHTDKREHQLLQHFKGFIIRTASPAFDPEFARLMDFRISQKHGTSFVYLMPLSSSEALVEYTLFTESLLEPSEYDRAIHQYVESLPGMTAYETLDEEFGIIPMTSYRFKRFEGKVINIGTAGGQTKGSSGYTFRFIQKQSDSILKRLLAGQFPVEERDRVQKKFDWFDATLLNVIATRKLPGSAVFTRLFRSNSMTDVFRFLDNETSLKQDIRIIRSLPILPFTRAALSELRHLF